MDFPAALHFESLPQVSLGTAALLIFGACASLAVLRGLIRILAGTAVICLSACAAYLAWRYAPVIPLPYGSWIAPCAAGLISLLVLRSLLRFAVRPFQAPNDGVAESNKRSPLRWFVTTVFSLLPAGLLAFTGAAAVRNVGSVQEIRRFADGRNDAGAGLLADWKRVIDGLAPDSWLQAVDPLGNDARVNLAKLIAVGKPPPRAIPVLEEPEIRQLILHDPKLRELARSKRYADILRDPRLDHVVADPDLNKLLSRLEL